MGAGVARAAEAFTPAAAGDGAAPTTIALLLESDGPGGAEIMLIQTAEELRRRGHDVVPVGPAAGCGWLAGQLRERGFEPEVFRLSGALDWDCVRSLLEVVDRRGVKVLHSHEFTMAFYCSVISRLRGLPHVTTMHGSSRMLLKWTRRLALRLAFRSSRVVAVSSDTRQHLVDTLRLPDSRVTTIPNGIRVRPGAREPVRRELGLMPTDILIVAVGNLVPRKGHIHLLGALARLDRAGAPRNWHVAIAGRGDERERLLAFARDAGFADHVHLLGHRDDVPDIVSAADIFAMPSLWEGLPVALLEAMFLGKPVVASGVSGIPEAVHDGVHGFLTVPGDEESIGTALGRLLGDSDLRLRLGESARARAGDRFSVGVMVDAYEREYGLRR